MGRIEYARPINHLPDPGIPASFFRNLEVKAEFLLPLLQFTSVPESRGLGGLGLCHGSTVQCGNTTESPKGDGNLDSRFVNKLVCLLVWNMSGRTGEGIDAVTGPRVESGR